MDSESAPHTILVRARARLFRESAAAMLHTFLKSLPVGDNVRIFLGVCFVCGVGAYPVLTSSALSV